MSVPTRASFAVSTRRLLRDDKPCRYHIVSSSHETCGLAHFDVTTETDGSAARVRRCSREICAGFFFDGERAFDVFDYGRNRVELTQHSGDAAVRQAP